MVRVMNGSVIGQQDSANRSLLPSGMVDWLKRSADRIRGRSALLWKKTTRSWWSSRSNKTHRDLDPKKLGSAFRSHPLLSITSYPPKNRHSILSALLRTARTALLLRRRRPQRSKLFPLRSCQHFLHRDELILFQLS